MTGPYVEDPVLGTASRFRRAIGEDGSEVLHVETRVAPGGGVGPHLHPAMEERFEVLEGRPQLLLGRRWAEFGPGEVVVVPPGTRHAFRNRAEEPAALHCEATPPSTLQEFLEETARLSRSGAIGRSGLPRGLDGLLRAAVILHRHREMVTLLAPLPPPALQRLLVPPLARLGERRAGRQA